MRQRLVLSTSLAGLLCCLLLPTQVRLAPGSLVDSQFVEPGLQVSTTNVPLHEVHTRLQNHAAWGDFIVRQDPSPVVHIDPRSGTPSSIILRSPIVPGSANELALQDVRAQLGRGVQDVTSDVVADLVMQYIADNSEVFAIALDQLGPGQVAQVTDSLWQISIPQVVGNVPVRHSRVVATINHGNLVLIGTEIWGNAAISTAPKISGDEAIKIGFSHVGGRLPDDRIYKQPVLEIVPVAPPGRELAYDAVTGIIGGGYGHRLVWSFGFERTTDFGRWELLVDAQSGEVISLYDNSSYAKRRIRGWVYPMTNTGVCPSNDRCGTIHLDYPMPWADYGPSLYANGAGVFEFGGSGTTTLKGKYVRFDPPGCGQLAVSGGGDIILGLGDELHDCPEPLPQIAGDSPAARTAFYEANKIAEIARGWVPGNPWLKGDTANCPRTPIKVRDNAVGGSCFAQYVGQSTPSTISFGKTQDLPSDCRNQGEIATVISHEWAHALDDNDLSCTDDNFSKPREAFADIAAIYRHQASCFGYGRLKTTTNLTSACPSPPDYPLTSDGTGKNARENLVGVLTCDTDCSGYRDADYARHDHDPNTPGTPEPDTPQNWVCMSCSPNDPNPSPCAGRQIHCAAAPITQAAWDLVKPGGDLRVAPFNYDSVTAFIIANKLLYQGSSNIGFWHACDCATGTSDGCGAGSGYMHWLTADDDNGNLLDGTPHMTALYGAFHRHGIACTPNVLAAADHRTSLGRIVPPNTYLDTRTSNNVREVLEEGYDDGVSRLEHVWRFDGLEVDVPHTLILEGYRPNNSENDNFQFYYSTNDINWTLIPNAKINKVIEPAGGLSYPFGGPHSSTMYVKVEDTSVLTGPMLDRVYVDFLAIGQGAPIPQNSGCSGGPTQAPNFTSVTPGSYQVALAWDGVAGAVKYWVFRTEGHAGCNLGMALIAQPIAQQGSNAYTDTEVAAQRQYCYAVMAAGGNGSEASKCFSPASACQCVTPTL